MGWSVPWKKDELLLGLSKNMDELLSLLGLL